MKALPLVLMSVLVLAACQKDATVRQAYGTGFVQIAGSELVLKQPLTIPAGRARVFIQDGAAPGSGSRVLGSFDHYRPHCAFEIRSVEHGGFTIHPDTFRIVRVQGSLVPVVWRSPVQLASLQQTGGMDDLGSSAYYEGYHFWLVSDSQPEVRRMSCYGAYAEPYDLHPPTLQEIDRALGAIAEIRR